MLIATLGLHRRAVTAAAALGSAALLIGCGSSTPVLSSFHVERGIAQSILSQHRVDAIVSCPTTVRMQMGLRFACTARLQAGAYPVSVVETDRQGHVRWATSDPLVILSVGRVERSIADSIRRQRGLRSAVGCPAQVLQKAGVVFKCQATVGGRRYPFTVTEIDGRGHVRYLGS